MDEGDSGMCTSQILDNKKSLFYKGKEQETELGMGKKYAVCTIKYFLIGW